ncbi:hypothetical protein [Kitasatospora sp. NPDC058478]|uniref:hypothetical protein n=1 Tax=unclassified Kitasatospora TaxID=2633591 RepID=UPI0036622B0D
MTTTAQTPQTHIALAAAAPIASAMAYLPSDTRFVVRFAYHDQHVTAFYYGAHLTPEALNHVMTTVVTAFRSAGWDHSNRYAGDGETVLRTRFDHPTTPAQRTPAPRATFTDVLEAFAEHMSQDDAATRLAPHMTPEEAMALAHLLSRFGHTASVINWLTIQHAN